jgi:hypothetical protein
MGRTQTTETIEAMAAIWHGMLTHAEREEIREIGADGWRGGATPEELELSEEDIAQLLRELERLCRTEAK